MIESPTSCWLLTPEGAAVHEAERTAVIADVHLGYEWSRGSGGDVIPAHSLRETIRRLEPLFDRADIERLVIAGDLVESAGCPRTARDVRGLEAWLSRRDIRLVRVAGNHDPMNRIDRLDVGGWTIAHGHRDLDAARLLIGHHHPALRAGGATGRCFLVGPELIVLPAFSPNAAGWNVAGGFLPAPLREKGLHCLAIAEEEILDFGPLEALPALLSS